MTYAHNSADQRELRKLREHVYAEHRRLIGDKTLHDLDLLA